MGQLKTTTDVTNWSFQDTHVERLLDNAGFTSAHPDDTLILAGPARFPGTVDSLLAIGMMQNFSASQQKPMQPVMAIGSGRQFFVGGKAQTSWNIGRLFVNGRNLLRVLHTQARQANIDVSGFDDQAAVNDPSEQFWVNLDSELFLIPFGLAVFFRDKTHGMIGAFYMELCVISSWSIAVQAGTNMIAEAVSGMADRILPIFPQQFPGTQNSNYPAQSTLDTSVLGLSSSATIPDGTK